MASSSPTPAVVAAADTDTFARKAVRLLEKSRRLPAGVIARNSRIVCKVIKDVAACVTVAERVDKIYTTTLDLVSCNYMGNSGIELGALIARWFCAELRQAFKTSANDYAFALFVAKNVVYPLLTATFILDDATAAQLLDYEKTFNEKINAETHLDSMEALDKAYKEGSKQFAVQKRVQAWLDMIALQTSDKAVCEAGAAAVAIWLLLCRESNDHRYGGDRPLPLHLSTVGGADPHSIALLLMAAATNMEVARWIAFQMDYVTRPAGRPYMDQYPTHPLDGLGAPRESWQGSSETILTYHQVLVFEEALGKGLLPNLKGLFNVDREVGLWDISSDSDWPAMEPRGYPAARSYHAVALL